MSDKPDILIRLQRREIEEVYGGHGSVLEIRDEDITDAIHEIAALRQTGAFTDLVGGHIQWVEFLEMVKTVFNEPGDEYEFEHLGHVLGKLAQQKDEITALKKQLAALDPPEGR